MGDWARWRAILLPDRLVFGDRRINIERESDGVGLEFLFEAAEARDSFCHGVVRLVP